jgi:DNA repair protein RadC
MPDRTARHRIADLQRSDRPRERLANQGAGALAEAELVAILLRTGIQGMSALRLAETLLQDCGGVAGLRHARYDELRGRHGIGSAKAAQLLAAVIVAHNHPSGDPSPSPEDIAVTRALVEAGRLLDIEVLDHLIIGKDRHLSLRQAGLGFG